MKLDETIKLNCVGAAPAVGVSSVMTGRKYRVVSTRYGMNPGKNGLTDDRIISEWPTLEEAQRASDAMPYTKVVVGPLPEDQTMQVRDLARRRLVQTNPDVD